MQDAADIYRKAYGEHGASYKSLLWGREERQHITYRVLAKEVDFRGRSMLDVGCGFGDFLSFLMMIGNGPQSYAGIDPCLEFIAESRERYDEDKDLSFLHLDYQGFERGHPFARFDWIVAIGVSATMPTTGTNGSDLMSLIQFMWDRCYEGFALTCLSAIDYEGRLTSHSPPIVLDKILKLTSNVSLHHDYGEQEFLIVARKENVR